MSLAIAVPQHIAALQARYRAKGTLTPEQVQTLLDWQLQTVEVSQQQAKQAGEAGTLEAGDLVEFQMPATVQGGHANLESRVTTGPAGRPTGSSVSSRDGRTLIGLRSSRIAGEGAAGTGLRDHLEITIPALRCPA
jgi:hypothetical protein